MEMFIDRDELAKILGIPESTVDYLRRAGKIPFYKVGKHCRYVLAEVQKILKENGR
ncbi:MAG: helix-turn-helix domain-containing protein [Candidatus Omnitrophica bacterium]|nr:helix-turn-helix domain-containing protein [Candidatus Omnitrophota bacterium]